MITTITYKTLYKIKLLFQQNKCFLNISTCEESTFKELQNTFFENFSLFFYQDGTVMLALYFGFQKEFLHLAQ